MGRRLYAGKANHFSGFLFHFVKEKGYTQGTKANKGHTRFMCCNKQAAIFHMDWNQGKQGNLHSLSICPSDSRRKPAVVSPAFLPCDHPGSCCMENWFLLQPLTLSPHHSPKPMTIAACPRRTGTRDGGQREEGLKMGYTRRIGPVGKGKRVRGELSQYSYVLLKYLIFFLPTSVYSCCHVS